MAKNQSFGDKSKRGKSKKDMIKLIRSTKSSKSGAYKFSAEILRVPEGKTHDNYVKELLSK